MTLHTHTIPSGHHLVFIAENGGIVLRLSIDDANQTVDSNFTTLRWGVCDQPWTNGDKLILRIAQTGQSPASVTNDTECLTLPGS